MGEKQWLREENLRLQSQLAALQSQNEQLIRQLASPVDLVESLMGGMKALLVPDLPPPSEAPDLFGGVETEINNGFVPDPAWDVPEILPSEFVEMEERERQEGGG